MHADCTIDLAKLEVGAQIRRPTFLIIGAMKSATTSLHEYLAAHPQICMSSVKEPGFFVEELNWSRGWQWYSSLFESKPNSVAVGESSTHYSKYPFYAGAASRIAAELPDVRFIYIMREPVRRAISHYWWLVDADTHFWWGRRTESETRSIERALSGDNIYLNVSRYALQIEQYLPYFSLDRFLFLTYEELKRDPGAVLKKCFGFLGVNPNCECPESGTIYNATSSEGRQLRGWLHAIRWSPWWTRIAPCVPSGLKRYAQRFELKKLKKDRQLSSSLRSRLETYFKTENERLFSLIGTRFEEWTYA